MQGEKLKEQLRNTLMERKREAKKAFDMAGAFSKDAAARPSGARSGKKSDDSTVKVTPTCAKLWYLGLQLSEFHLCRMAVAFAVGSLQHYSSSTEYHPHQPHHLRNVIVVQAASLWPPL